MAATERWEEVVSRLFKERDPEKRKALVEELHSALDERAQKIRSTWLHQNGGSRRDQFHRTPANVA